MKRGIPLNLQFFADEGASEPNQTPPVQQQPFTFDYDKLADIVGKRTATTEDSVLAGYFKEQGLSKEELNQAIATFKDQKAKSQPDINAIQTQLSTLQAEKQQVLVEKEATIAALALGIGIT